MVFSNLIFLYLFLPLCLAAYFLCRSVPAKNAVLIVFSLIFYAWGEPVYLFLMIAAAAVNWGFGLLIEKRHKRVFLVLALVLDLGCLAVFKYTGFVVENLNALFGASIPVPAIALPIGISFYTFQALSYTVDVWRGDVPAQRSFAKFLLYISLFPQLIAGPIVRYADVAGQIDARSFDAADAFYGATRFCIGLAKKVLLADAAGKVAAQILDGSAASATTAAAWLGIVLYTFEIYFDFSGYSDMAIGLGRMLGFRFLENFNYPFLADSITDFWRRWHISMGTWFRDYVYIPLGGNKGGLAKQLRNIAIVWLLTGFWHGASWNFVLWGVYFGILLVLEKLFLLRWLKRLPAVLRHIYALVLVTISWTLFAFTEISKGAAWCKAMFSGVPFDSGSLYLLLTYGPMLAICALAATPLGKRFYEKLGTRLGQRALTVVDCGGLACVLVMAAAYLVSGSYNPFLYFRF